MGISGFEKIIFSDNNYAHPVYIKGRGPKIVLMHELPGLTEPVINLAERLINDGFQVHVPHLFGDLMSPSSTKNLLRLCISKEFGRLKAGVSAPVIDWLREYVKTIEPCEGGAVGVIGMCVTGAFVIPLLLVHSIRAGVVSQPAVPFSITYRYTGLGKGKWMTQLNISDSDLANASLEAKHNSKVILVQRFKEDRLCPHARVARIASSFGTSATLYEYNSPMPHVAHPHALLTEEYEAAIEDQSDSTRVAYKRLVNFFHGNLKS